MFREPEATPKGFRYDLRGLSYFEVHNDMMITLVDSKIGSIERKEEDSCYGAYQRSNAGESRILVSTLDRYNNSVIYLVEDLDAFADSFGIRRESDHVHDIKWRLSKTSSDDKRYVYIDVTMMCGCKMGKENARVMRDVLRETLGCDVVLGSFPSDARSSCTLKAIRNTVKLTGQEG